MTGAKIEQIPILHSLPFFVKHDLQRKIGRRLNANGRFFSRVISTFISTNDKADLTAIGDFGRLQRNFVIGL